MDLEEQLSPLGSWYSMQSLIWHQLVQDSIHQLKHGTSSHYPVSLGHVLKQFSLCPEAVLTMSGMLSLAGLSISFLLPSQELFVYRNEVTKLLLSQITLSGCY